MAPGSTRSLPSRLRSSRSSPTGGEPAGQHQRPSRTGKPKLEGGEHGRDRPGSSGQRSAGRGPRGILATLYFDQETGLLLRMVRYSRSPIGRVPTQVDYGDYRDVGGIKMPFRMIFAWMDGRDAIQLSEIRTNVPIDDAKFRPPARPPAGRQ